MAEVLICQIAWWVEIVSALALFGFNISDSLKEYLSDKLHIRKGIINTLLALFLFGALIICNPYFSFFTN